MVKTKSSSAANFILRLAMAALFLVMVTPTRATLTNDVSNSMIPGEDFSVTNKLINFGSNSGQSVSQNAQNQHTLNVTNTVQHHKQLSVLQTIQTHGANSSNQNAGSSPAASTALPVPYQSFWIGSTFVQNINSSRAAVTNNNASTTTSRSNTAQLTAGSSQVPSVSNVQNLYIIASLGPGWMPSGAYATNADSGSIDYSLDPNQQIEAILFSPITDSIALALLATCSFLFFFFALKTKQSLPSLPR